MTTIEVATLQRTLSLLQECGWGVYFSSGTSPMNIRSAVSKACYEEELRGNAEFYRLYVKVIGLIAAHIGTGVQEWESKKRTQSQVEQMLTQLIQQEEHHATAKAQRQSPGSSTQHHSVGRTRSGL